MSYRESRGSFATSAAAKFSKASAYSNAFSRLSKPIGSNVQKIQSSVQKMKAMLKDLEGMPGDKLKLSKLHEMHQKTNAMVKETGKSLKDLQNLPKANDMSEQKRQKLQTERLVDEFSKALNNFQEFQSLEKEKTKAQVIRDRQSVKRMKASIRESEKQRDALALQPQEQQQQQLQIIVLEEISDIELELMKEREEDLKKLEANIMDVHQIFQDLGAMVHDQGEVIVTIEKNVELAAANIEEAKEDLQIAHNYSVKVQKKKCIIIAVVSAVVVVVIIIILASVLSTRK